MGKIAEIRARIQAQAGAGATPRVIPHGVAGKAALASAAASLAQGFAADVDGLRGLAEEARMALKRQLVERYRAHAEAFLRGPGGGVQDPVAALWVIWLWDIGELESFLVHCARAEALDQRSPFATPLQEFRWRRTLDWAREEHEAGRSAEPYFSQVSAELERMPGSIAWGYHGLAGRIAVAHAQRAEQDEDADLARAGYTEAIACFEEAHKASPKARVKTELERARKALTRLEQPGPPNDRRGAPTGI